MKTLTNRVLNFGVTSFTLNVKNSFFTPPFKLNISFKRKFSLLLFSFILSFGIFSQSFGQCSNYTWTNSSGCDWDITFFDNAGIPIIASMTTATAGGGPSTVPPSLCFGCSTSFTGGSVEFSNACGCIIIVPLTAGGVYTNIATDCANQGCSSINCSGSPSTTQISVTWNPSGLTCTAEATIDIQ